MNVCSSFRHLVKYTCHCCTGHCDDLTMLHVQVLTKSASPVLGYNPPRPFLPSLLQVHLFRRLQSGARALLSNTPGQLVDSASGSAALAWPQPQTFHKACLLAASVSIAIATYVKSQPHASFYLRISSSVEISPVEVLNALALCCLSIAKACEGRISIPTRYLTECIFQSLLPGRTTSRQPSLAL